MATVSSESMVGADGESRDYVVSASVEYESNANDCDRPRAHNYEGRKLTSSDGC